MSLLEFRQLCYFMSNQGCYVLRIGSLCTRLGEFYSGVTLFCAFEWKLMHALKQNHA